MTDVGPVGNTVVNEMIRTWRKARLERDVGHLGYPTINILHPKHGIGDSDEDAIEGDAETVQRIVERMPDGIRTSFEAFHLGIIRAEFCRDKPHKWRALVLGLDYSLYLSRERAGWRFVRDHLCLD